MDKNIGVIIKHPAGTGGAFVVNGPLSQVAESVLNFITDGGKLTGAVTAANDKVIGERAYFANIQQDDVRGLLF